MHSGKHEEFDLEFEMAAIKVGAMHSTLYCVTKQAKKQNMIFIDVVENYTKLGKPLPNLPVFLFDLYR